MKTTTAALAALLALSGSAFAQTPLVEIADDVMVDQLGANVDTVDDWDVFLADGTEIGDVDEVLGSDAATPTALGVDFEGNNGYADRDVVVPLDQFALVNGRLVLNADPAAVQAMPEWDD
jgi:hypothetical protein